MGECRDALPRRQDARRLDVDLLREHGDVRCPPARRYSTHRHVSGSVTFRSQCRPDSSPTRTPESMTPHPFFSTSGQRPLVIAHRGARAHAPENTLAAARLAHNHGADLWELDVCRTRDGVLVVLHDDTCARTTDAGLHPALAGRAPWPVHELSLAEIQTLDAGSWFVESDPFGRIALGEVGPGMCRGYKREPVPTLAEALELTRTLHWRVNVEIKDLAGTPGDATVVDEVLALVHGCAMETSVLLSSFRHDYMREAHRKAPHIATALLIESIGSRAPLTLCHEAGATALHPRDTLMDDDSLGACLAAGLHVNVWTVNDLREAARLARMGASGIITDIPGECLAALRAQRLRTDAPVRHHPHTTPA